MVKDTFTLEELEKAIWTCPRFNFTPPPRPAVDDSSIDPIKVIEIEMLFFRLLGSKRDIYEEYKKNSELLQKLATNK